LDPGALLNMMATVLFPPLDFALIFPSDGGLCREARLTLQPVTVRVCR
jgi:hypothetical protein